MKSLWNVSSAHEYFSVDETRTDCPLLIQPSIKVFYNIGKVTADSGHTTQGELAYREAIRYAG